MDNLIEWMGIRWDRVGVTRVTLRPQLLNRNGVAAGPIAYTLVDYAMGSALWPHTTDEENIATLNISITYLRGPRDGELVCTATLDRRTRTNAALRAEVVQEETGELVATAVGTYAIFKAKTKPS
jgi:uncharacterized protein (TIGR00369 family)